MSREEIVDAYIEGEISRRTFVRRLVAVGVSAGAATAYAHLIGQDRASAAPRGTDQYGVEGLRVRILTDRLQALIRTWRLRVRVHSDEADAEIALVASARISGEVRVIARKKITLDQPGTRRVRMRVRRRWRDAIEERDRLKVTVTADGQAPPDFFHSIASDTRILS